MSRTTHQSRPSPVLGWLSVLCPVTALLLGIAGAFSANSQMAVLGVIYLCAAVAVVGGTLCAILSFRRKERRPVIAVVGLLLSLVPFLFLVAAVVLQRSSQ